MGACDGCGTPEDVRQDNHIHVELDFVPVEERLPECELPVAGLISILGRRASLPEEVVYAKGLWWKGRSGLGGIARVTHWSEIPTIEERE